MHCPFLHMNILWGIFFLTVDLSCYINAAHVLCTKTQTYQLYNNCYINGIHCRLMTRCVYNVCVVYVRVQMCHHPLTTLCFFITLRIFLTTSCVGSNAHFENDWFISKISRSEYRIFSKSLSLEQLVFIIWQGILKHFL